MSAATPPPSVKKACDACHRRKVKCSGGRPCQNCGQASLLCTYNAIPQKKGPKGTRAKVISELRNSQQKSDGWQRPQSRRQDTGSSFDFSSPPTSPTFPEQEVLSRQMIDDCIDVFFTSMYPTMPILHRDRLLEKVEYELDRSVETYCLIGSLCAFMMVQPGMKNPGNFAMDPVAVKSRCIAASALLEDVVRVRKTYDYVDAPTLDGVRTSFFMYAACFNLDRHNTAWFHLREATTLAHIMGMHQEKSYLIGDHLGNIYRRRLYWLLFLTERAYSIERHRPLTLHATIELPTLNEEPEQASTISGFLHMINLFRALDDTFVGLWNKSRTDCSTAWLANLQQQLSDALPPNLNSTESQAADIRISQQWLRTMVWQLSITNGYLSSSSPDSSMTFKYPIEIARDLARDISILSIQSMEVHGIGLIEKLFDVACTLTDVIACVPLETSELDTAPSDCLNQLLHLISQLRGGGSRFLPLLVAKVSENLPLMVAPTPTPLPHIHVEEERDATSPAESSDSAPLIRPSPISPIPLALTSSFTDPMASGPSPPGSSEALSLSPWTPKAEILVAPVPRSVPRVNFDANYG